MLRTTVTCTMLAVTLLAFPAVLPAGDVYEKTFGSVQPATVDDMNIMKPYIGTFRGSTQVFDDGETEYHFALNYEWWGGGEQLVKYTVSMVIPSQDRTLVRSEGYYGFDPFTKRIYVFGVFAGGMTGRGFMGKFDAEAGTREVWARSMDAEGVVNWVKDGFEVIDGDSWRNRTMLRRGDDVEWQQVHEDVYTRVIDSAD